MREVNIIKMPSFAVSLLEWTQLLLRRIRFLASLQKQLLTAFAVLFPPKCSTALAPVIFFKNYFKYRSDEVSSLARCPQYKVCLPYWSPGALPYSPFLTLTRRARSSPTGRCSALQTSQPLHLRSDQFFLVSAFLLLTFEVINGPASWNQFFLTWAPIALTHFQHAVSTPPPTAGTVYSLSQTRSELSSVFDMENDTFYLPAEKCVRFSKRDAKNAITKSCPGYKF